jgi:hypothetical protein
VLIVTGMCLLIFVAVETGVCVTLPSKLTSASAAIPAFGHCLPSGGSVIEVLFRHSPAETEEKNETFNQDSR